MKQQFVQTYYPYAKEAEQRTGIPALFGLAQCALETGWGKTIKGNMLFGIKVGSGRNYGGWQGDKQLIKTTEYSRISTKWFPVILSGFPVQLASGKWKYRVLDNFRAYVSPLHSFIDWAGLLKSNARYRSAFQHTANPHQFANEIANAGYATDPNYAYKISQLIFEIEALVPVSSKKRSFKNTKKPLIAFVTIGATLITLAILKLTDVWK